MVVSKFPDRVRKELPRRIMRPCDFGLLAAFNAAETQLGTIEAYNRIAELAEKVKNKIDRGRAVSQNPIYATKIRG